MSKTNLKHVKLQSSFQKKDIEQQVQNEGCNYKKVLRSEGNTVDWSMCIICQRTKYKGSKALSQVLTEIAQSTLRKAAEVLKDQEIQFRISGTDLIAYEVSITVAAVKSTFSSQKICLKYQQKKILMSMIKHLTNFFKSIMPTSLTEAKQ